MWVSFFLALNCYLIAIPCFSNCMYTNRSVFGDSGKLARIKEQDAVFSQVRNDITTTRRRQASSAKHCYRICTSLCVSVFAYMCCMLLFSYVYLHALLSMIVIETICTAVGARAHAPTRLCMRARIWDLSCIQYIHLCQWGTCLSVQLFFLMYFEFKTRLCQYLSITLIIILTSLNFFYLVLILIIKIIIITIISLYFLSCSQPIPFSGHPHHYRYRAWPVDQTLCGARRGCRQARSVPASPPQFFIIDTLALLLAQRNGLRELEGNVSQSFDY